MTKVTDIKGVNKTLVPKYKNNNNNILVTKYISSKSETEEEEYAKMILSYLILTKQKKELRKVWMSQFSLYITVNNKPYLVTNINPRANNVWALDEFNKLSKFDFVDVYKTMREFK